MSSARAIADAIAARFEGVTVGGKSPAIGPTALLPNTVGKSALLVYPPIAALDNGPNRRRQDELIFPVRMLLDPLDVKRRSAALYDWYDAMRPKVDEKIQLGLDYIAWARADQARLELDGQEYGDSTYDVVEILVRVKLFEHISSMSV